MAQQPQGKHMEVKHMDDSDKMLAPGDFSR